MRTVRWLLATLALAGLAGGVAMAQSTASDNGGSAAGDATAAAPAPQDQHPGGDFRGRDDFRRGGARDGGFHGGFDGGREGPWEHHGWHRAWYHRGWYGGGPAIIVRPGFGPGPYRMHRRFQGFGPGGMDGPGGPGMLDHPLLGAFRRLDLTTDQRQKIRTVLMTARRQGMPRGAAAQGDFTALINPGDPNHARAVQAAKDRASQRIQQASQTEQDLYNVLTAQQKTQLTQTFAQMRTRMQQRAARSGQDRGARGRRGEQPGGQPDAEAQPDEPPPGG
ncbi:MAG TPA: hypothetical protein VHX52_13670 [Steroidobacteraceae bacterium]|jgi:Spy/CpxP family protein refolding chaperone|nr:hypothetical protein [Steroidobacteraceae bacterium]